MGSYKDDAQFNRLKIDLTNRKPVVIETFYEEWDRVEKEQKEKNTTGPTIAVFRQRINDQICKKFKVDARFLNNNNLVDKYKTEIQKMFDQKVAPGAAAKKLIDLHEDNVQGFTFYISNTESLDQHKTY